MKPNGHNVSVKGKKHKSKTPLKIISDCDKTPYQINRSRHSFWQNPFSIKLIYDSQSYTVDKHNVPCRNYTVNHDSFLGVILLPKNIPLQS